jgi:hypothetical protein
VDSGRASTVFLEHVPSSNLIQHSSPDGILPGICTRHVPSCQHSLRIPLLRGVWVIPPPPPLDRWEICLGRFVLSAVILYGFPLAPLPHTIRILSQTQMILLWWWHTGRTWLLSQKFQSDLCRCRPWILLEELAEERLQLPPPVLHALPLLPNGLAEGPPPHSEAADQGTTEQRKAGKGTHGGARRHSRKAVAGATATERRSS